MSLEVPLENGEVLDRHLIYRPKPEAVPYAMAVSNRAIFTLAKQGGLVADPWYLQRVPLADVRKVSLVRARSYGLYFLGGVLVIGGLAALVFMLGPVMAGEGGVVKAAPLFGVAYGGFLIYHALGRRTIVVETTAKTIRLTPPTSLGVPDKKEINRIQEAFLGACQKVGIPVETISHRDKTEEHRAA